MIDLGQDLDGRPAGHGQNAYYLARLEAGAGTGQDLRWRRQPPACALGQRVQPAGITLRKAVTADPQMLPFPARERLGSPAIRHRPPVVPRPDGHRRRP